MQVFISFFNFLFIFLIVFIGLFIFWGNMYRQGFRNEKIWNFIIILATISLTLGKVLYIISSNTKINLTFFNFIGPPYLLGGVIIGAIFVTNVLCRANNWSVYRAGDYVALALNLFFFLINLHQSIFYFIYHNTYSINLIIITILYLALYIYLTKLIKVQVFSGYIFTVFLISVSVIESINLFWVYKSFQFSHTLYFAIIMFAVINLLERYKEIKVMQTNLPKDFIDEMKERLEDQNKQITEELEELSEDDAFVKDDSRVEHNAEQAEEAEELEEHYDNKANRNVLAKLQAQIKKALARIKAGKYGIDKKTGKPISKERLKANPSATTNVETKD